MHVSSFFIVVVFALVTTHMARLSGNVSFVKAAFFSSSSSSSIVVRKKSVVVPAAAAASRPTTTTTAGSFVTTAAAAAVWGQQQQQQRSAAAAGGGGGRGVLLGISTMMMMKNHNCCNNNRGNNGVVVASFHSRRTTTTRTTTRRTSRLSAAAETTTTTTTTSSSSTTEQEQEAGESTAEEDDYNDDDDDDDNEMIRRAVGEFDIKAYFASQLPAIEEALQESVQSTMKETDTICESMSYSLMAGGKRIRPILCLAAAEMFIHNSNNNSNNDSEKNENDNKEQDIDYNKITKQLVYEKAMPTAVALEMIHTMSLIHDDLPSMDNDDLRRGKPTNHVVYGEDVAILAGDALLSTSFQHVAEKTVGVDSDKVLDVIVRLGKSVGPIGLAGGQVMDLQCEGKPSSDVTIDDLRWIHTHKTATLLQVAIASGATLGGATNNEVKACEEFALNIGLAFQVADDILDVTQSTEELGKTAGKDIDSDKVTYPRLLGLDGARMEAKKLIEKAKSSMKPFGNRAIPLLALADFIINRTN